jgi:predicted Zn-dependent protease
MLRTVLPLLLLTACGGGGGSSTAPSPIETALPPVTPSAPVTYPTEGTPVGEPFCETNDRMQTYADGVGGEYTERLVHLDQSCFVQMSEPQECNTTATATGDPRYNFVACDGVKQTTPVSFPFDPQQEETAVIDMLVVVDTNLTEEDRDGMTVEEFVDRQVYESNKMYIESGTKTLIRVAGIKMVDVKSGDLYRQYYNFFYGRQEFVGLTTWQNDAGADLAFLFKKIHDEPVACGVASLDATEGVDKTRGITQCFHNSVFQENETTRYYERAQETFAHEVGHLMGAAHDAVNANKPGLFEYSFGYNIPGDDPQKDNPDYVGSWGGYGTIMSYADLSTARFSDYRRHRELYNGQSVELGSQDTQQTNNAETIARTRYLVSQLHELGHNIEGSVYGGQEQFNVSPIHSHDHDDKLCFF